MQNKHFIFDPYQFNRYEKSKQANLFVLISAISATTMTFPILGISLSFFYIFDISFIILSFITITFLKKINGTLLPSRMFICASVGSMSNTTFFFLTHTMFSNILSETEFLFIYFSFGALIWVSFLSSTILLYIYYFKTRKELTDYALSINPVHQAQLNLQPQQENNLNSTLFK